MGFAQSTMRPQKNLWGKHITAPGCDDAPVVDIAIGDSPKHVTLVIPYYDNPRTLQGQVAAFQRLPKTMREYLQLIIVDDCSPGTPARDALFGVAIENVSVFRIGVDVRFNWLAARNIGAHEAAEGTWLALTDIDHHYPYTTITALVYGQHDPETIYRFTRHDGYVGNDSEIHPHPNSFFMTREMFWRTGGYNEAFSGLYGSDGEYRRRCVKTAPIAIMNRPLVRKEHDGDSSTTGYGRKEPQDRAIHELAAQLEGTPPKVLSFPYERVL